MIMAVIIALLMHIVLLAGLRGVFPEPVAKSPDVEEKKLAVRVISQSEFKKVLTKIREKKIIKPKDKPKPKPKPKEAPKPKPAPLPDNRKIVTQVTNSKVPTKAKYLSQAANKTDNETRAKKTTLSEVIPDNSQNTPKEDAGSPDPDPQRNKKNEDAKKVTNKPVELAKAVTKPAKAPTTPQPPEETTKQDRQKPAEQNDKKIKETEDGPMVYKDYRKHKDKLVPVDRDAPDSPVVKKAKQSDETQKGQPNPRKIFAAPAMADVERAFGKKDDALVSKQPKNRRQRMFSNIKRRQKLLKGSLENMITEIKPGNFTSVNAHASIPAGYLASIHRRIHKRWANDFLIGIDINYPRSSPLQNPKLHTTLEFVIDAKTGKFDAVNIAQSSGVLMFDAEAIDTSWAVGARPNPPRQIVSPNGKIYIHWNFWRDGRQCGLFGAKIYILNKKGHKAPAKKSIQNMAKKKAPKKQK